MTGKVYKRVIDGLTYKTTNKLTVEGYEAPLFELQTPYGIKMTRKAWEAGIPGSCTNCALTVAGRRDGVKGIWLGRYVAYLLFRLNDTRAVAFFKARVPAETRDAFDAHDRDDIEACPDGTFWFLPLKAGTIDRKRKYDRDYKAARPHTWDSKKPKKHSDTIHGTYEMSETLKQRDGRGKVKITAI